MIHGKRCTQSADGARLDDRRPGDGASSSKGPQPAELQMSSREEPKGPGCRNYDDHTAHQELVESCRAESRYLTAPEDELLREAKSGGQQAFAELCRRHAPIAKRRILSIVRHQEDAEDVLQETLLRAYTHLDGFNGRCKFSTWIVSIGVNSALMLLRKRKARAKTHAEMCNDDLVTFAALEFADSSPNPEQVLAKRQSRLLLKREMQRLRPSFRIAIEAYYGSEGSLEETAGALGISEAAAKARLFRGRLKLRSSLRRYGMISSGT